MPESYLIGLDLGGTAVKGAALTPDGRELMRDIAPFRLDEPMAFAEAVKTLLQRLESSLGTEATTVGLSAPGLAAIDGRSIAFMPGRFPGLAGLDWQQFLERPAVPVLNDANAALLGEVWLGAARGAREAILLTLGTGVGGAVMVQGQLLRGRSGKAGHLGHVSLDPSGPMDITNIPGSLEDAIGNHNVRLRSGGRFESTQELVRAHEAGDAMATDAWLRSVRALAAAIASFTNILDPEFVIIGGGISRCGDALFSPLREMVQRFEWQVCGVSARIVPAELGEMAGAYGAARNAFDNATGRT
jgi:glucokinase